MQFVRVVRLQCPKLLSVKVNRHNVANARRYQELIDNSKSNAIACSCDDSKGIALAIPVKQRTLFYLHYLISQCGNHDEGVFEGRYFNSNNSASQLYLPTES